MKPLKMFLSIISPLADIISILVFLGISFPNINFDKAPWYLYIIIFILSITLFRLVFNKIVEIKEIYADEKVKEDLNIISSQKNIQNIKQAIPTTQTLRRLYEKVKLRIYEWDNNAVIKSFTLYLEYTDKSWEKPHIQIIAYSRWKNEEGWFYEGRHKSETFNENEKIYIDKYLPENKLFFNVNPSWQKVIKKSFDAVSSKLTDECKIRIDESSICIGYKEGKVEKTKVFKIGVNYCDIIPE